MVNLRDKEFTFEGLDAQTEIRLSLILIIPGLFVMLGTLFVVNYFFPKIFFLFALIFAALLTLSVCMLILKKLVTNIKDKKWSIKINDTNINIKFQKNIYQFNLSEIKEIKNMGNAGFRYLTIKTRNEKVKIRVGDTGLTPFSTQEDIKKLDAFVEYLMPYFKENFNQKELKNIINTNIFPNFGVYVVKGEKIQYSIINKMRPWQIISLLIGSSIIIMILFVQIMESIFFK